MFKIDWATALGGAAIGYLVKSKIESTKNQFRGIYTGAINTLKESFSDDSKESQSTQNTQGTQGTQGTGGRKNG